MDEMRIQLEGCVDNFGEYSMTSSQTLSEALEAQFGAKASERLLKRIDNGKKVDLSLPLETFDRDRTSRNHAAGHFEIALSALSSICSPNQLVQDTVLAIIIAGAL